MRIVSDFWKAAIAITLVGSVAATAEDEWSLDAPGTGEGFTQFQVIAAHGRAPTAPPRIFRVGYFTAENQYQKENEIVAVRQVDPLTGYGFWAVDLSPPPLPNRWTPSPVNEMGMPDPNYVSRLILNGSVEQENLSQYVE